MNSDPNTDSTEHNETTTSRRMTLGGIAGLGGTAIAPLTTGGSATGPDAEANTDSAGDDAKADAHSQSGTGRQRPGVNLHSALTVINGVELHLEGVEVVERIGVWTGDADQEDQTVEQWLSPAQGEHFLVVGLATSFYHGSRDTPEDRPQMKDLLPEVDSWYAEVDIGDGPAEDWHCRHPVQLTQDIPETSPLWYSFPDEVKHPAYGRGARPYETYIQLLVFDADLDAASAVKVSQGAPVPNFALAYAIEGD